jgi:hypothetical protein
MGYMTTITFLNDAEDQIMKHPDQVVENIHLAMCGVTERTGREMGIGNHANCMEALPPHHADTPQLMLAYQNMTVAFGYFNNLKDPRHLDLRKRLLRIAQEILYQEKCLIKELEEQMKKRIGGECMMYPSLIRSVYRHGSDI